MLSCRHTVLTAPNLADIVFAYPGKTTESSMQDKQKVTLYLPPELHRKLKIQAAMSSEAMSILAERALNFYLTYPEVVEQQEEAHGQTHRIYDCPSCTTPVVLRNGELTPLGQQGSILQDELSTVSIEEKVVVPC
ncbi:hypothetical protein LEP3755_16220 [Leptolyngbya sp. NIES-3755]|nr:hypothetical protein LEP3755_16220 [Leptolyngbya sp. NIES-3755]